MQNVVRFGPPALGAAVLAVLYMTGVLPPHWLAAGLAAAAVLLPALYGGKVVAEGAPNGGARVAVMALAVLTTAIACLPVYDALFPGAASFTGQLSETAKTVDLGQVGGGGYWLTVSGSLREREGSVTADYRLKVSDPKGTKTVDGSLWRRFDRVRVGRKGSGVAEHHRTFERHPLTIAEGTTQVSLVKIDPELTAGLKFELHKLMLPTLWFVLLGGALFVGGAVLEALYASEKNRSLLTTLLALVLGFAYLLPDQLSAEGALRPVIGSFVGAGFVAIVVGGIASWVTRKLVRRQPAPESKESRSAA